MSNDVKIKVERIIPDLQEKEIRGKRPAELDTKAKVSRYFLNALTINVETLKRYEADLFSDSFELIDSQTKKDLKNRFNLIVKDFKGLSLSYWQKKVVTACFCLIDKKGATDSRPIIEIESKADLYAEVLEGRGSGQFLGSEREKFDQALEELQTMKQQVIFHKNIKDSKGKKKREYIMIEAPLVAGIVYNLTSEGEKTVEDIKGKAKISIQFNPVIFHGLIDNWRLIPKNTAREIKSICKDVERVTSLMEDFILFLHGHAPHTLEIRRSRPVLVQELKIEREYKKNKKRTTDNLLQAYDIAKRTGYLTDYRLNEKRTGLIVDVFSLNPEKYEHLRNKALLPEPEEVETEAKV